MPIRDTYTLKHLFGAGRPHFGLHERLEIVPLGNEILALAVDKTGREPYDAWQLLCGVRQCVVVKGDDRVAHDAVCICIYIHIYIFGFLLYVYLSVCIYIHEPHDARQNLKSVQQYVITEKKR